MQLTFLFGVMASLVSVGFLIWSERVVGASSSANRLVSSEVEEQERAMVESHQLFGRLVVFSLVVSLVVAVLRQVWPDIFTDTFYRFTGRVRPSRARSSEDPSIAEE
jgi:hypothetical protein